MSTGLLLLIIGFCIDFLAIAVAGHNMDKAFRAGEFSFGKHIGAVVAAAGGSMLAMLGGVLLLIDLVQKFSH